MDRYKHLHLWMLIPMGIMQAGILFDYWGDFAENAWSVHVHYWLASVWYLFLIAQPWLVANGRMAAHRTWGMIGLFIAGGVGWVALSMMHRDLVSATRAAAEPEAFGPFKPWFFHGVAVVEIVMIAAFLFAIVQAIRLRKQIEEHAWWLISTVFMIMMPALARGLQAVWFMIYGFEPDMSVMPPLYFSLGIIIALTLAAAAHMRKLRHPATILAIGVNAFSFLLEPIGRSPAVQALLTAAIKG